MILPRASIFIAFSAEYFPLMRRLYQFIEELYQNENIWVKPVVLSKVEIDNAGATPVINLLEERIDDIKGAIVIYSPDVSVKDSKNALKFFPRPNIIFEVGLLYKALPNNNVTLLVLNGASLFSDIDGLTYIPVEIPPDASEAGLIEIMNQSIKPILTTIYQGRFLKLEKNPLLIDRYQPDYSSAYREESYQRKELEVLFIKQLNELTDLEQKIVFLAERMLYTSVIRPIADQLFEIMNNQVEYRLDFNDYSKRNSDQNYLNYCLLAIQLVIEYLKLRQEQRLASLSQAFDFTNNYAVLISDWENPLEWFSNEENSKKLNPLIPLLYFDYFGLALHKYILLIKESADLHEDILSKINLANHCFSKALAQACRVDINNSRYWEGYVMFDFARLKAFEYSYLKEKDSNADLLETVFKDAQVYFRKTIEIRRNWFLRNQNLPDPIKIQLQCEYFYACIDCIEFIRQYPNARNLAIHIQAETVRKEFDEWTKRNNDSLSDLINDVSARMKKINL
jgi:hypothetical protein